MTAKVSSIQVKRVGIDLFDDWQSPLLGIDAENSVALYNDTRVEMMQAAFPGATVTLEDFSGCNVWVPESDLPGYGQTRMLTENVRETDEGISIYLADNPELWLIEEGVE